MNIKINYLLNDKIIKNDIQHNTQNIIEVSNLYPNNLIKQNIRADQRNLISYLRSEAYSICRTEIPFEYIKTSFNKFKKGFVYYKDKLPVAFCIWKVKEHLRFSGTFKELYIFLICGKQLDYKLVPRIIDDIVHLCRKNNIQYISLEPVNDTLKSYYIKCGFKERYEFANTKILELDVSSRIIQKQSNKTFTIKTRKTCKRRNKLSKLSKL